MTLMCLKSSGREGNASQRRRRNGRRADRHRELHCWRNRPARQSCGQSGHPRAAFVCGRCRRTRQRHSRQA